MDQAAVRSQPRTCAYSHKDVTTLDGSVEATRSHVDVTVSERAGHHQSARWDTCEAPGDREHARGRPHLSSKHNDLSVRDVAATCFDVCAAKVLIAIDRCVSQTAPLRLSSVVSSIGWEQDANVESYRFPLPTVCFECQQASSRSAVCQHND
jgi:hypothetical protein